MQAVFGLLLFASVVGVPLGLLMCLSPAKREMGKTIAMGSAACFGAALVVTVAKGPDASAAPATDMTQAAPAAPKSLSHNQMLANFRIRALSWQKQAFGTMMVASFTIHNDNTISVKDVEITCASSASSGSTIDHNTRMVYEVVRARSFLQVDKFNMGFVRTQITDTSCRVTGFSRA